MNIGGVQSLGLAAEHGSVTLAALILQMGIEFLSDRESEDRHLEVLAGVAY